MERLKAFLEHSLGLAGITLVLLVFFGTGTALLYLQVLLYPVAGILLAGTLMVLLVGSSWLLALPGEIIENISKRVANRKGNAEAKTQEISSGSEAEALGEPDEEHHEPDTEAGEDSLRQAALAAERGAEAQVEAEAESTATESEPESWQAQAKAKYLAKAEQEQLAARREAEAKAKERAEYEALGEKAEEEVKQQKARLLAEEQKRRADLAAESAAEEESEDDRIEPSAPQKVNPSDRNRRLRVTEEITALARKAVLPLMQAGFELEPGHTLYTGEEMLLRRRELLHFRGPFGELLSETRNEIRTKLKRTVDELGPPDNKLLSDVYGGDKQPVEWVQLQRHCEDILNLQIYQCRGPRVVGRHRVRGSVVRASGMQIAFVWEDMLIIGESLSTGNNRRFLCLELGDNAMVQSVGSNSDRYSTITTAEVIKAFKLDGQLTERLRAMGEAGEVFRGDPTEEDSPEGWYLDWMLPSRNRYRFWDGSQTTSTIELSSD